MPSILLLFLILTSGVHKTTNNLSTRNKRQIFYPGRPMIYTERPLPVTQKETSNDIKEPTTPSKPTTKKAHKTSTPEVNLIGMPVGVPLSLLPPPSGPIPTGPFRTNDVMPQFAARGFFGVRNRPMMQSASFANTENTRFNPSKMAAHSESMADLFPKYSEVPRTSFRCSEHEFPGYYGDVEARCQVVHVCQSDGRHDSFLCPNGTVFNQQYFVCDWWFNVDCSRTSVLYSMNSQLYRP